MKTLHHYDRIGLLKPVRVEGYTGYRYYNRQQVEQMLLIQRLKRYQFSLEEIRELLNCTEERVLFSKLLKQKEKQREQKRETEVYFPVKLSKEMK